MKLSFEVISVETKPEEAYTAKNWPASGVYECNNVLYFVDQAYGSVNTVYGNYTAYMTVAEETGPQVDKQLLLEVVSAFSGKYLGG